MNLSDTKTIVLLFNHPRAIDAPFDPREADSSPQSTSPIKYHFSLDDDEKEVSLSIALVNLAWTTIRNSFEI